jgi:hypothetical protein
VTAGRRWLHVILRQHVVGRHTLPRSRLAKLVCDSESFSLFVLEEAAPSERLHGDFAEKLAEAASACLRWAQ